MADYDLKGALDAGVSPADIVDFLSTKKNYDAEAARKAGVSDWEILSELTKTPPGALTAMARGFARSVGELGILGGDIIPAMAASVLPESVGGEYARQQLREAEVSRAKLEAKYPTAYESYKDVEGPMSALGYAAERFGQILPDIAPSILTGGVGYTAGKRLAQKGATELGEQLAKKTEREMLESGFMATDRQAGEALKNMAGEVGKRAMDDAVRIGGTRGMQAGVFLGSYAQNAPEVFENIYQETGSMAPGGALLFGGLSAMLDSYLPAKVLGDLGNFGKNQLVARMLKDSGADPVVWRSVLKESGKAALGEGLTETAQEGISVAAEKLYGSNKEFFDPKNVERYLESFFAGSIGGGGIGALSGVGRSLQAKEAQRQQEVAAALKPGAVQAQVDTLIGKPGEKPPAAKPPVSPLEGFDLTKVDPVKLQTAEQFLKDLQANALVDAQGQPLSKLDANKKLQTVVRGLGIPLKKGTSKKTSDLTSLLTQALTPKGAADVTGPQQQGVGAGVTIPGGPVPPGAPGQLTPPQGGGVGIPAAGAAGVGVGAGAGPSALDALKARLAEAKAKKASVKKGEGLAIGDEGVFETEALKTSPEQIELVDVNNQIDAARTELKQAQAQEEPDEAKISSLEKLLEGLYDKQGKLTDKLTKAKPGAPGVFTYMPGKVTPESVPEQRTPGEPIDPELAALEAEIRQVEGETEEIRLNKQLQRDYETVREDFGKVREEDLEGLPEGQKATYRKALPEWGELSLDEKQVFEDALGYYETIPEALDELAAYRQMKGNTKGNKNTALASYEINRRAESNKRGVEFPRWTILSEEQRQAYLDKVSSPEERTAKYPGPDFGTMQSGFDAVEGLMPIESRAGYRTAQEQVTLKQTEAAARERARQQQEATELGLENPLPVNIADAVKQGDLRTVLDYLGSWKEGTKGIAAQVRRLVANSLSSVLLDDRLGSAVKLVYNENYTGIARYEPKSNSILVGPRGLQEVAVLHEAVHAATVRVIYTFLSGNRNLLSKEQQEAVVQLQRLMEHTKKRLGSKYSRAYKNLYEFVAYATTDPKFQEDLRGIELAPSTRMIKYSNLPEDESRDTAFDRFTRAITYALELPERFARMVKNIFSYAKYYELTKATEEEFSEQVSELTGNFDVAAREAEISKEIKEELKADTQKVDVARELNQARQNFKKVSNKYKGQTAEQLNANEEYTTAKQRYDEAQANADALKTGTDLEALGVTTTREAGHLGNVLVEIFGAFDQIMDAPPMEGIPNWDNKPLYISAPKEGLKIEEAEKTRKEKLDHIQTSSVSKVGKTIKGVFTKAGYDNLIRAVQNKTIAFDRLVEKLRKLNLARFSGPEYNVIDTAYYQGTAIATNKEMEFYPLTKRAGDLMKSLMKDMKLDYTGLLARLQTYMIGLNEPERRHIRFLKEVPLIDTAATQRQKIIEETTGPLADQITAAMQAKDQQALATLRQRADQLRKDLEAIVADPNNRSNKDTNINDEFSSNYNTLGYDIDQVRLAQTMYNDAVANHPDLAELLATLNQIMDKTQEVNTESNYFSGGVQSIIWFYGWKNYYPFKGREDVSGKETNPYLNPFGENLAGDFARGENTFMGRQSDADNPVLQIFTEATRASMRYGYREAPIAMSNLIKQGHVHGDKKPKIIKFKDRYLNGIKDSVELTQGSFFVYQPNGDIHVYNITDPDMRRAFKGLYTPDTPLVDLANSITSRVGQLHTRYNPAFAPLDFTRNLLTYGGIVSAKYGPVAGAKIIAQLAKVVSEGGMHKTFKYTMAYNQGDRAALDKMRASDPDGYYKDIDDYYNLGGPVAYVQGLTAAQTQETLHKQLKAMKVAGVGAKEIQDFFDSWIATFETSTRIAAFRTIRQELKRLHPDMDPGDLDKAAMSETKDLANFQKVGELGKHLGAMFMFWRPAATGAIKAIDALLPAFDTRSEAELFEYYKKAAVPGQVTDEQAQGAVEAHIRERQNARNTAYVLAGAGAFMYMMAYMLAGDDDEGRNKTQIDDMARWVRFARFNTGIEIGGRDLVMQMPWGFGPGAFAAAGAQIAAVAMGGQNLLSAANNIMDAGFESFVPLPTSKIDKFANPTGWMVDSITPSVLRPLVEFSMNTDGLGRKIYSDRQSRYADAYLGSDNIPSIWNDVARGFFKTTGIDVSPSSLYFFSNNYMDGLTRAIATSYNIFQVAVGDKDFDPRTDTYFLDSYFKAPSNYDAIQFSKAENKIKEMEKTLNALKGTPELADYLADNPMAPQIVKFYNQTVNGSMRNIRAQLNTIRRSDMPPNEKQPMITLLNKQQNQIKSAFTNAMAGLDEDFASFGYDD